MKARPVRRSTKVDAEVKTGKRIRRTLCQDSGFARSAD